MLNLMRREPKVGVAAFDPFRDLEAFFDMRRWPWVAPEYTSAPSVRMDVAEDEKAYYVKAEVPGVPKEGIHVAIDANTVTISAEAKAETGKHEENMIVRERRYGRMWRSFALGQEVDEAKAQARYVDGVLELTLPKKATAPRKELPIQ